MKDISERKLSSSEMDEKEKNVKGMKKSFASFRKRYGDRAKEVMYATATKMAKEEVELEEGMTLKDFKANRRKIKRKEASTDAKKRGHVGKEWYNSGQTYSPDEAKRGRANMQDHERSTRHRSAVDPEAEDDNYSADKTKNPKKLRKQKAMGEQTLHEDEYRKMMAQERRAEKKHEREWRKSGKVGEKKTGPKLSTTKHSEKKGSDYAEKEMHSVRAHDRVTKKAKHTVGNPFPESYALKPFKSFLDEGAAWTRKEGQNSAGGLNEKGRKSYERENPGSDLKAPSKKVGNSRRASFCARMKGMRKRQKAENNTGNDRLSKSLKAWNC